MTGAGERPWWLGAEVVCEGCSSPHAALLEVRCADCDAPACPHCAHRSGIARARSTHLCAGCAGPGAGGDVGSVAGGR